MRRALMSSIAGTAIVLGVMAGPAAGMANAASATRVGHTAPAIFIPKDVSATDCIIHGGQPNYFFNVCEGGLFDGWPLDPWTPAAAHVAVPPLAVTL